MAHLSRMGCEVEHQWMSFAVACSTVLVEQVLKVFSLVWLGALTCQDGPSGNAVATGGGSTWCGTC